MSILKSLFYSCDKPQKSRPAIPVVVSCYATSKIDGAVATVMALDRAVRCGNNIVVSVYDEKGILYMKTFPKKILTQIQIYTTIYILNTNKYKQIQKTRKAYIVDKMLSIRNNKQISSLFAEIHEYQKSANRTEIVNWALDKAKEQEVKWKEISLKKIKVVEFENKQPEFMQIRVNEEKYVAIDSEIKKTFKLKRLTCPYLIQLILINYLESLKDSNEEIINSNEFERIKEHDTDLNSLEMIKLLTELLLQSRKADEEIIENISEVLVNWRDNLYAE